MPNVFDVLSHDHQEVKQMLSDLEKDLNTAATPTGDQIRRRKKLSEQLVIEESKHEAVEEMYFWPAVRERVQDGDRLADQATGQEQEGKEVLDKLDKLGASDPQFAKLLGQFISAGREHIQFEETQVWPNLRAVLSEQEADELGRKLEKAKKTAPTRPHPKTPPDPRVLKTAAAAAAAMDRARDAATGRGRS